jgi:hypothetical protein
MCPPQVEDLVAKLDHSAVHDPSIDRRDLAGRDSDHGLVQEGNAFSGLSKHDQRLPVPQASQSQEVRVVETVSNGDHLFKGGVSVGRIA